MVVEFENPYPSWVSGRLLEWRDKPDMEERLWPQRHTFGPVLDLLKRLANTYRVWHFSEEDLGRFAHTIHAVIRSIHYSVTVRDVRQKDSVDAGGYLRRRTIVGWRTASEGPAAQLRRLDMAARRLQNAPEGIASVFKLEQAWRALTPAARSLVQQGVHDARAKGLLRAIRGPLMVEPVILSGDLPSPQLLGVVLPFARERAAHYRGRPERQAKDAAVSTLIDIFMQISGRATDGLIRGDSQGPSGPAATFITEVETTFGIDLLSKRSVHGVRRARQLRDSNKDGNVEAAAK
jgi:hypothetical protein